jgi:hypothetical protein
MSCPNQQRRRYTRKAVLLLTSAPNPAIERTAKPPLIGILVGRRKVCERSSREASDERFQVFRDMGGDQDASDAAVFKAIVGSVTIVSPTIDAQYLQASSARLRFLLATSVGLAPITSPKGNPMVCYVCGSPASAQCADCKRYICGEHTRFTHCRRETIWPFTEKCHFRTVCPTHDFVQTHWD